MVPVGQMEVQDVPLGGWFPGSRHQLELPVGPLVTQLDPPAGQQIPLMFLESPGQVLVQEHELGSKGAP